MENQSPQSTPLSSSKPISSPGYNCSAQQVAIQVAHLLLHADRQLFVGAMYVESIDMSKSWKPCYKPST